MSSLAAPLCVFMAAGRASNDIDVLLRKSKLQMMLRFYGLGAKFMNFSTARSVLLLRTLKYKTSRAMCTLVFWL